MGKHNEAKIPMQVSADTASKKHINNLIIWSLLQFNSKSAFAYLNKLISNLKFYKCLKKTRVTVSS